MLRMRKRPAPGELATDEVGRPAGIEPCLDKTRIGVRVPTALPGLALAHSQSFFAVEPIDAIDS